MNSYIEEGIKPTFRSSEKPDFYALLKTRVNEYFESTNQSRNANRIIIFKTFVLLTIYCTSYFAIMSNAYQGLALIGWFSLLGLTMGMLGFNLSHDIMHNAFFKKPKWNRIASYFFDINGTSSYVWKHTHNLYHHIYTNIPGHDQDIDKAILLRLSPKDQLYPFHAYQHLYAPFLYLFTSLNWMFYSDFKWFYQAAQLNKVSKSDLILFLSLKSVYLLLFLIFPLLFLSAPSWQILLGFLCLHFAGGLMIAIVFQLAHIIETVQFPSCDLEGKIDDPWVIHELKTTSNFATNSKIWGHLVGGLNYQIEHHLFAHICHVHYPALSKIVKQATQEFGLPYIEQPSFIEAVCSHFRTLKRFGKIN